MKNNKRGNRRDQTQRVVRKRLKSILDNFPKGHFSWQWLKMAQYRAKSHNPISCQNPQCIACHYPKIMGEPTRADLRAKLDQHDER